MEVNRAYFFPVPLCRMSLRRVSILNTGAFLERINACTPKCQFILLLCYIGQPLIRTLFPSTDMTMLSKRALQSRDTGKNTEQA